MRDPDTVTEPSLVCSLGLKASIFAGGGLSAALSLPLGTASSANAPPTANIAPSTKMQTLFIKPSPALDRHPCMGGLQSGHHARFRVRRQRRAAADKPRPGRVKRWGSASRSRARAD